ARRPGYFWRWQPGCTACADLTAMTASPDPGHFREARVPRDRRRRLHRTTLTLCPLLVGALSLQGSFDPFVRVGAEKRPSGAAGWRKVGNVRVAPVYLPVGRPMVSKYRPRRPSVAEQCQPNPTDSENRTGQHRG